VLREGSIERINPKDLVVGDIIVLQVRFELVSFFAGFISFPLERFPRTGW
jgi:hypothetical protein